MLYKQYEPQSCAQLLAPVYSALASSVEKLRDQLKVEPIRPPETPKKAPVKPQVTKPAAPQGFKERLLQQWEDEMTARLAPPPPPPPADPAPEREPSPPPVIVPQADVPAPPADADMDVEPATANPPPVETPTVPEPPKVEEVPAPVPEAIPEAPTPRRTISLADYLKRKSLAAASTESAPSVSVPITPVPAVEEKKPDGSNASSPSHDKPHHHKPGPPPPYMLNVMDWTKRTEFDAVPPQSTEGEKITASPTLHE